MKFCTNCGKEIPENAKFCPECGTSTDENAAGGGDALPPETVPGAVANPTGNNTPQTLPGAGANTTAHYTPPGRLSFSGRATRGEFFTTCLISTVLAGILVAMDMAAAASMAENDGDGLGIAIVVNAIFGIPMVIWALATQVRRLHDIGWSGLCVLLPLIPFVGWIGGMVLWVVELFMDGQPGPNRYGPDPKGRPSPYAGGTVTGTIRFSTQG